MSLSTGLRGIRPEVLRVADDVRKIRRDLHAHPELSWRETRTQGVILDHLTDFGLHGVRSVARTGATALVRGRSERPCVLWRADIDALPIPERSGLPYASKVEGVMHACGHDAHVAIALGMACVLSERLEELPGSVRFVFQPAEESSGGALGCINDGVLEKPSVDRVLGLHVSADVPLGAVNVAPGPFFAAPTRFKVVITGRGGHAASPHQSVDAIVVGAHVITALQTVVSRSVGPSETAVLTIGTLNAGYRANIIAETAELSGTIRSYSDRVRDLMLARAEEIVAGVCAAFGATYSFEQSTGCPPLVNDAAVAGLVEAEALQLLGAGSVYAAPSMGADDMAEFLMRRPGCYFWLGGRNEARGIAGRHHDPGFVIDEEVLTLGVELGLRLIERSLAELARSS